MLGYRPIGGAPLGGSASQPGINASIVEQDDTLSATISAPSNGFPLPIGDPLVYVMDTTTASHVVPLPTLVMNAKVTIGLIVNANVTITTPTNWQLIAGPNPTPGSYDSIRVYQRDIDGTWISDTTVTFAISASQRAQAIVLQTSGGRAGYSSNEIAASSFVESASSFTADPPSLTPAWGAAENCLWLAWGFAQDGNATFSSFPTNYDLAQAQSAIAGGAGNAIALATRPLNASTEDPGAFTYTGSTRNRTGLTIAIRPADAGNAINASITEADDTVSSTVKVDVKASVSITEANDTGTGTVAVAVRASAAITEANDTVAATVAVAVKVTASITEGNDTLSSAVVVLSKLSAAITEADDTLAAAAAVLAKITASITEGDDTLNASITGASSGIVSANITEQDDTVAATAKVEIKLTSSVTEGNDTVAVTATVAVKLNAAITEGNDTVLAAAAVIARITAAITEQNDTATGAAAVRSILTAAITEQNDTLSASITGLVTSVVTAAITEGDDTLSAEVRDASPPPPIIRHGGTEDPQQEYERRQLERQEQLRQIIDRSLRIVQGEIDPVTYKPIPPPDYSAVVGEMLRQATALDQARAQAFMEEQARLQEEEAISILLLAA